MSEQLKANKKKAIQVYLNQKELEFIDKLQRSLMEDGIEKSHSSIIRESFIKHNMKEID